MNRAVLDRAALGLPNIGVADVGNVGVMGAYDDTEVKPYIKGHVTDGSSTFTFKVNNTDVTVPVDTNGNWKWVVDRTVTSLASAFESNLVIDKVVICGINTLTSGNKTFNGCKNIKSCTFKNCDASLLTDASYMFQNMGINYNGELQLKLPKNFAPVNMLRCFSGYRPFNRESLDKGVFKNATNIQIVLGSAIMDIADLSEFYVKNYWYRNGLPFEGTDIPTLILGTINTNKKVDADFFGNCVENIIIKGTYNVSLELNLCSKLTEQSVVNIFNAVAADITLTFHQNVWNMIMREIDVQGSPIQVAYQNMIDNYDVTIANASFDAEIEYIEGTGTQWIDTNIKFKPTTAFETRFMEINIPENPNPSNRTHIIGTHSGNTRYRLRRIELDVLYFLYGSNGLNWGAISAYTNIIVDVYFSTTMLKCKKDNGNWIEKDISGAEQFVESPDTITLFHGKNISNTDTNFEGRFYYLKIWDNDNLVADFIPVRKGTTGYLYDKVSGNLFGNSGTGDFVLGNDK